MKKLFALMLVLAGFAGCSKDSNETIIADVNEIRIRGTVTDETKQPLDGIKVSTDDGESYTYTNADGLYDLAYRTKTIDKTVRFRFTDIGNGVYASREIEYPLASFQKKETVNAGGQKVDRYTKDNADVVLSRSE